MTKSKEKMPDEVWRITNYDNAEEYYFCSEDCAQSYFGAGDLGDPEDVTEDLLDDARSEEWSCYFCQQAIVRNL
jgi:hypothetical protein